MGEISNGRDFEWELFRIGSPSSNTFRELSSLKDTLRLKDASIERNLAERARGVA